MQKKGLMKRGPVWYSSATAIGIGAILVILWLGESYIFAPAGYERGVALVRNLEIFGTMSPGELMRAEGQSEFDGTQMLLVVNQNINSYSVTYFDVPSKTCRYAIDTAFTSNIVSRISVNNHKIYLNTYNSTDYNYTQIRKMAFSRSQDLMAREYCESEQMRGKNKIRFDIIIHTVDVSQ